MFELNRQLEFFI
jgi:5'-3' exoribonuclease 1